MNVPIISTRTRLMTTRGGGCARRYALVGGVQPGCPAAYAGVTPGHLLGFVNSEPVNGYPLPQVTLKGQKDVGRGELMRGCPLPQVMQKVQSERPLTLGFLVAVDQASLRYVRCAGRDNSILNGQKGVGPSELMRGGY